MLPGPDATSASLVPDPISAVHTVSIVKCTPPHLNDSGGSVLLLLLLLLSLCPLLFVLLLLLLLLLQVVTAPITAFVGFIVDLIVGMFIWPKRFTVSCGTENKSVTSPHSCVVFTK